MSYRHSQSARITLVFGAVAAVIAAAIAVVRPAESGWDALLVLAFVFLAVALLIASQLTVSVETGAAVVASFRWGWPRRRVAFDDIVGVRLVRNSWWHGWGIRKVRHGWMYNVAGYDAVELALRSGKVFRIGTDEPDALLAALGSTASSESAPA